MDLGIMFFSTLHESACRDRYRLLLETARFADREGFRCVWTPERHGHPFGGLFPNPSVTSAALAMVTDRLQLRAGSLISPLHQPLRIAEEWSVVDNLSRGRVAISFGSGWNADDFVFFPERYAERQRVMYDQLAQVRSLWRGESLRQPNGAGKQISVTLFPRPVQPELPVWITSSGNPATFVGAGAAGANLLTHLIGQDLEAVAAKIDLYREARREHGFAGGTVSMMLHTFVGNDREALRSKVRGPFREYLRTAVSLEQLAAAGGGAISGGHRVDPHDIPRDVLEDLLDVTCERYLQGASLIGTPAECATMIDRLAAIGVDEIACLIDFLPDRQAIEESLVLLAELRAAVAGAAPAGLQAASFSGDLEG
ncbi:MAG TPA: MupA/Atu3671 family FMN-dependent luciferase-like monooxygenase [Thermoanaerobaculia bacterium]|nr:MupA/Atu3671 family FMN-dependent luciferase-like monooxygenase [Thermoanaerobaculia bacterium]